MIDGKSVANMSHEQLGGAVSSGEFGTMLAHIFDPETGAEFDWEKWATLRGHRMYVFSYSVPKSAGYSMYTASQSASTPRRTRAWSTRIAKPRR